MFPQHQNFLAAFFQEGDAHLCWMTYRIMIMTKMVQMKWRRRQSWCWWWYHHDDEYGDEDYDYKGDAMMTKMVRMMMMTKMMMEITAKMVQMMLMTTKPVCRLWPKWLWLDDYLLHLTYYPSLCCFTVAHNISAAVLFSLLLVGAISRSSGNDVTGAVSG